MNKIKSISLMIFSVIMLNQHAHAETTQEVVAKIGLFSVIEENCEEGGYACDYNLYEGEDFRLPLVVQWKRGLNIESQSPQLLHFSYGYTFNIHHSIFISKDGIVQAIDDVLAVDDKTGCIVRYSRGEGIPTLYFQKVFSGKIAKEISFDERKYPRLNQNLLMPYDYFLEPKFNKNGDFVFAFEYQENKIIMINQPCGGSI